MSWWLAGALVLVTGFALGSGALKMLGALMLVLPFAILIASTLLIIVSFIIGQFYIYHTKKNYKDVALFRDYGKRKTPEGEHLKS